MVMLSSAEFQIIQREERGLPPRGGRVTLDPLKDRKEDVCLWVYLPSGLAFRLSHRPANGESLRSIYDGLRKAVIDKVRVKRVEKGPKLAPADRATKRTQAELAAMLRRATRAAQGKTQKPRANIPEERNDVVPTQFTPEDKLVFLRLLWTFEVARTGLITFNSNLQNAMRNRCVEGGLARMNALLDLMVREGLIRGNRDDARYLTIGFTEDGKRMLEEHPEDDNRGKPGDQNDGKGGDPVVPPPGAGSGDKLKNFIGLLTNVEMQNLVMGVLKRAFGGEQFTSMSASAKLTEICDREPDARGAGKVLGVLVGLGLVLKLPDKKYLLVQNPPVVKGGGTEDVSAGAVSGVGTSPTSSTEVGEALTEFDESLRVIKEKLCALQRQLQDDIARITAELGEKQRHLAGVNARLDRFGG